MVGGIASLVVISGAVSLYKRRGNGAAWGWMPAWAFKRGARDKSLLVHGNSSDGVLGSSGAGVRGLGSRSGVVSMNRVADGQGGDEGEGAQGSYSMVAAGVDAAAVMLDVAGAEAAEGAESVGGVAERCLLASEAVLRGALRVVTSPARCQQLATGVARLIPKLQEIHRQAQQQGGR